MASESVSAAGLLRRLEEDGEVGEAMLTDLCAHFREHPEYRGISTLLMWILGGEINAIGAAVRLVETTLPGWAWRIATCCVSDDAWVFPDFNSPAHGGRLRGDFSDSVDWVGLTDVDVRPPGRPAIALLISIFRVLAELERRREAGQ